MSTTKIKKTAASARKPDAEELQALIDLALLLAQDSGCFDFYDDMRYFIDQMTRVLAGKDYKKVVTSNFEWLPGAKPSGYDLPKAAKQK